MSEYRPESPTTEFVRAAYVEVATRLDGNPTTETAEKEFDRWLAELIWDVEERMIDTTLAAYGITPSEETDK